MPPLPQRNDCPPTPLGSAGSIVESPLTLIKTRMESSLAFEYTGIIQVPVPSTAALPLTSLTLVCRRCVRCTFWMALLVSCGDGPLLLLAMRRA